MDASEEILQYCHLMAHPEYRVVWGKSCAKELGRLSQGLTGVVDGTDTFDFIIKNEEPFNRYKYLTYGQIV